MNTRKNSAALQREAKHVGMRHANACRKAQITLLENMQPASLLGRCLKTGLLDRLGTFWINLLVDFARRVEDAPATYNGAF
jgi:hypothetical protein